MPVGAGDENFDDDPITTVTDHKSHPKLKRWEHALLDLRKGHNIGCHKYCDALNVKLLYMTMGCLLWITMGSFVFAALEEKNMLKYQKGAHDFDGMVNTLRNVSTSGVMPHPLFQGPNLNFTKRQLTHAANFMAQNKPATIQWGPAGGFFFSIPSMTTIGYGRFLIPKTTAGQLFVIPFTMVGIPLLAILYTAWARKALKSIKNAVKKFNGTGSVARWQTTVIAFGIFLIFLLGIGPAIFMETEGWEYHEAVYFVWVSVSTIGYGDYVPESTEGRTIGILLVPLGLGICALLLAAIVQWFEDLIVYMDYDMDSYVKWHNEQESGKQKKDPNAMYEGSASEALLPHGSSRSGIFQGDTPNKGADQDDEAASMEEGTADEPNYGATFDGSEDPQMQLARALDAKEAAEAALQQEKLENAETLKHMTKMLADAVVAKEKAEATLQDLETANAM